jgi:hypothetical protein
MRNLTSGLVFLVIVSWWPAFCQDVAPPLDIGGRSDDTFEYDEHWDYSGIKTYAWLPSPDRAENMANHLRVSRAIERGLEACGLVPNTEGKPDVFVRYILGTTTKLKGRSYQKDSDWQPNDRRTVVEFELGRSKVREGELAIELLDRETRAVIWRAVGKEPVARADKVEEQINEVVARLLAEFPPGAKQETAGPPGP